MSSSFFSLSPVGSSQIQRHQPLTAVGSPEPILKAGSPSPPPNQPQGPLHEGWLVTAVTQSFPTGPVGQCEDMPYGNE